MGKRGPKKGVNYNPNGLTNEVKIMLHRRKYPNATWTETARLIHPDSEAYSYCEFKNNKVKPAKRSYRKFITAFPRLGRAKTKEWEKLINGGRIAESLWTFSHEDKEHILITFKNSDRGYVFPKNELKDKWHDVILFLREGTIACWMVDNFASERALSRAWQKWRLGEKTREQILELRGDDHLHIVSILNETSEKDIAYLVTGKEMFEQLNQRERDGIEMILASTEKDKNKP